MKLTAQTPLQVRQNWQWWRAGIERCIDKTQAQFLPEDVFSRIHGNTAWAFVIGEDDGGIVLTQEWDSDGMVLYVWILFGERLREQGAAGGIYDELERIARETKARRIRMQSPRAAWKRETFFKAVSIIYEHEVDHG